MNVEKRAAAYALGVLTFINLFNYVDRWVVAAVLESIKKSEIHPTDTQLGLLSTGFLVVYAVTSPIFGSLGDKKARPPLIALGVAIWSVATGLAGFARGFATLFAARSAVGIGEASYGTIAPALLSDYFPIEKRGRAFAVFFGAIPVGSAVGYILGGLADHAFGWRAAFWIAGAPGLVLSLLVLKVVDLPRGRFDDAAAHAPISGNRYLDLLRNRTFILAALGYGAYTFALGGLAFWMPAFLVRARGMSTTQATVTFGIIAVATGFFGTFAGGWLGDLLLPRTKAAYLWVSGVATLIAAPVTYVALSNPDRAVYLTAIVIAEVLIFMCTGPINSAIVNAVAPGERATAVGLSVLVMHLVGDIPSPAIIGALSDASSLEHALCVLVPGAIVVAAAIWIWGAIVQPR